MRSALILAVWVLFAASFITGIVLRRRFTVHLMSNHSAAYAELGGPPPEYLPYDSRENLEALKAQSRFVQRKQDLALHDVELGRLGNALRRIMAAQIVLGACFAALVAWEIASGDTM